MQVITQTIQFDIGGEKGTLHRYLEAPLNLCLSDNVQLWKDSAPTGSLTGRFPKYARTRRDANSQFGAILLRNGRKPE